MKRFGFKMKMYPGFKEEYRKRHSEIWPELVVMLKNEGICNYSIFLDEETNILLHTRNKRGKALHRIWVPLKSSGNGGNIWQILWKQIPIARPSPYRLNRSFIWNENT